MRRKDVSSTESSCSARCLLPVPRDPHPAARSAHPLTANPNRCCSRRHNPAAGHPYVVGSRPAPVAGRPDISRTWGHGLRLNANCRRSPGHHDLPARPSCCHFLCSRRSRHCRWFGAAANQCKRRQQQQINASSHACLLHLVIRFRLVARLYLASVRDPNSSEAPTVIE